MPRRATAQDVADLAGVSRSAVSLVLNGRGDGNITASKQQAIFEAARHLDYRPNALALSLRSQRTRTLGILTWQARSGFPEEMLYGVWRSVTDAGYLPILMDTQNDPEHESRVVGALLDRQVDGFLVVAPELVEYHPPEATAGSTMVLIDCVDPDGLLPSAAPDEVAAGAQAVQALLDCGHREIAILCDDARTEQVRLRRAGTQAAVATAPGAHMYLLPPTQSIADAVRVTRDVLSGSSPPTAVVATRERFALGALLAAHELRLTIPRDLSLISLEDGELLARDLIPPIATVERPDRAMAEQGVGLLFDLLARRETTARQLRYAGPTHARGSLAPPSLLSRPVRTTEAAAGTP